MSTTPDDLSPYGLSCPTVGDAIAAIHRVHGADGSPIWARLLSQAGLAGGETDDESFERLLQAMTAADPISALCAHALRIRLTSYTQLAAAHELTRR
jgi:hypothetical protein